MVSGIGNDIVEIERVREGFERHGQTFLDRLFTKKEQEYCSAAADPFPRYAGRFSAKEAVVKALGCGFGKEASWLEIEILADSLGKPVVQFLGKMAENYPNSKILISISHCKSYATAVALLEN